MIFYATGNGKFYVFHDHVKCLGQEQKKCNEVQKRHYFRKNSRNSLSLTLEKVLRKR